MRCKDLVVDAFQPSITEPHHRARPLWIILVIVWLEISVVNFDRNLFTTNIGVDLFCLNAAVVNSDRHVSSLALSLQ